MDDRLIRHQLVVFGVCALLTMGCRRETAQKDPSAGVQLVRVPVALAGIPDDVLRVDATAAAVTLDGAVVPGGVSALAHALRSRHTERPTASVLVTLGPSATASTIVEVSLAGRRSRLARPRPSLLRPLRARRSCSGLCPASGKAAWSSSRSVESRSSGCFRELPASKRTSRAGAPLAFACVTPTRQRRRLDRLRRSPDGYHVN